MLLYFNENNAFAQCWSAGNPISGTGFEPVTSKGMFQISSSVKYSLSDQYYVHDHKIDNPYIEKSSYTYQDLTVHYGLTDRFSIYSEMGYFYDKSQDLDIIGSSYCLAAHGLSDVLFQVKGKLLKRVKPIKIIEAFVSVKMPVGAFQEDIDGITLPVSLQPSSGALKFNAGFQFQKASLNKKWAFLGSGIYEMSQWIKKGYLIYKYGDFFRISGGAYRQLNTQLSFSLLLVTDYHNKDIRENDQLVEASGSFSVHMKPYLQYSFNNGPSLFINSELPIYRYFFGEQLGNTYAFQVGLRYRFGGCQ